MATVLDFTVIARDRASKVFKDVGKSTDGTRTKMDKLRIAAGLAGAAIAAAALTIGRDAVKNASAAEQSLGATETVFGNFSKGVVKSSEKAAKSFGLSANEYRENANIIGSLLKNQGVAADKLAGQTNALITKGSDLAAVFGGTTKDAVDALSSAFKGEFDPIERYGISLKQSTVNAEAMNIAHVKTLGAFQKLTPAAQAAAKQQATLAIINKQSANTQGQFAKQTDTTAERLQIAKAQYTNLTATIGTQLLPVMNVLLGAGSATLTFLQKWGKFIIPVAAGLGVLAVAVWGINAAAKAYTATQAALNLVMSANPIGLVIIAIAALVVGIIIAYKKSEVFRNIVNGAFKAIGTAVKFLWENVLRPVFKLWINAWFTVIGAILDGAAKAFGWVPGIGGKLKAAASKFHDFRDAVNKQLDGIKDKTVHVTVKYTNAGVNLTAPSSVGRRASGGPVNRGTAYLVGEEGPELFVPGQSGGIIPNGQTKKAMSSSGGDTYVLNLTGMVGDKQSLARTIVAALQDLQRSSGRPIQISTAG